MGGYKGERWSLLANVSVCKDDANSLTFAEGVDTTYIAPQSNLVGGISAVLKPFERTTIEGEYALSIINANCKADSLGHTSGFFEGNTDISRHTAGKVSVSQAFEIGSIGATYERVSPFYKSFASYYNTNNFENITADFTLDIAQKVNLSTNVGWQRDNLNTHIFRECECHAKRKMVIWRLGVERAVIRTYKRHLGASDADHAVSELRHAEFHGAQLQRIGQCQLPLWRQGATCAEHKRQLYIPESVARAGEQPEVCK